MFEEIMGIPAHPLVVHAAVVFVPLLALLTIGYALVAPIRPHTRWVLGLLALGAPVFALLAKLSGDAFFQRMRDANRVTPEFVPKIEAHQSFGDSTLWATIALAIVALALVRFVPPQTTPTKAAEADAADDARRGRALTLTLQVLSLVAAAIAVYYVVRTGDSGAKAVWEGQ
ncbi:DUF2231 domain-containing protein [Micromonospora parathelypteridis]|uniref:DUF2231 domain-containing protein n=1 Tax=Micromonospora parathelypteridis TaxID=1839617 RepID=A0A840VPB7_9ACTN|nr:DUF2231 domain-containing protein [Micromonospora parathelypteridis]MBB5475884.1 hypothetical protein [Micromonospora parathelypteridis]GGO31884.1 hypothetical protein GCM10011576_61420 [Micromonospora parathelypteridis]